MTGARRRAVVTPTKIAPVKAPPPQTPPVPAVEEPVVLPEETPHTCGTCKAFLITDVSTGRGLCRRFPPAIVTTVPYSEITPSSDQHRRWPLSFISESCEEWRKK